MAKAGGFFHAIPLVFLLAAACVTGPVVQPVPIELPAQDTPRNPAVRGIADEIRYQIEVGSPASLGAALELIRGRDLVSSDFGRMMNAAAAALSRAVYPDLPVRYLSPDPPVTAAYTRILRDADKGVYTPPSPGSRDFLEYALPFIVFYSGKNQDAGQLQRALDGLEQAARLNGESVLPHLFRAFAHERAGSDSEAIAAYNRALGLAPDCYPAEIGLVRIMDRQGRREEAFAALEDLLIRYPDNLAVKKEMARAYTARENWSGAGAVLDEILRGSPKDGEFLLLKALVMLEQRRYQDAQIPLDAYASIDSGNHQYLFLRARLQAEGYNNRDSALNYLRSIIRSRPGDTEALVYTAGLLMGSARAADIVEGRNILSRLLAIPNPSPGVLSLAVTDAIRRESWREARNYLESLLSGRRGTIDLLHACAVERGLGNNAAALAYARELYGLEPDNDAAAGAYITALIDTGRQAEALQIIEQRLAALGGGGQKSRYFYLRSRLRTREDDAISDLRSSLFEDPRNPAALVAMFEIYHRRKDERRAVYYLKQALAIDPNNPSLRRYEAEYRASLGPGY